MMFDPTMRVQAAAACGALCAGCGADFKVCDPPSPSLQAALPAQLSQTGLFADTALDTLAAGVEPFAPQYELWSDGATKRRWIYLPPGTQIDRTDMDAWQFPIGTKLWKEFTRDGVRVETRLLFRVGPLPEDWAATAYIWQPGLADADRATDGVVDAAGTAHDVPAAKDCSGCHGGRASPVLGFSAVQLGYDGLRIPGDDTARDALGYLHANCGHCHNQARPPRTGARCFDPDNRLDFWLSVDALDDVASTPTYRSAIDYVIEPGDPDDSAMIKRITRRGDEHFVGMPPLATERVDDEAVALLRRWIVEMP